MILGIGADLCRIERIRRSVARFGKAWLDEIFTDEEQARLRLSEEQAHVAAIGFALKEACAKAIGTGFARGARPQNFVVAIEDDRCSVQLTGAAKRIATRLCPAFASPFLLTYHRTSEAWVSALAVITLEGETFRGLSDHLILSEAAALGALTTCSRRVLGLDREGNASPTAKPDVSAEPFCGEAPQRPRGRGRRLSP